MSKDVILTGIRANNDLHIGNYFGALLPIIDMAKSRSEEFEINLFVPDLHSFTTPIDHARLQTQIMNNLRIFVAAGLPLDNPSIHIYRQSYIPAHSELTWILDCFTSFYELRRLEQFEQKAGLSRGMNASLHHLFYERGEDKTIPDLSVISREELYADIKTYQTLLERHHLNNRRLASKGVTVGLFNYPVLMAADILLYGAKYVPVGDDQSQHLEFTRDISTRMNNQFGELFTVPEPVTKQHEFFGKDQGLRIKDLADPTKKMSKSDESSRGIIFLGDNPEDAAKKIMSATTDSESVVGNPDMQTRPGVANLLQILKLLNPTAPDASQMSYKDFKKTVAAEIKRFLADFQAKLSAVDEQEVVKKLETDEVLMTKKANKTLLEVHKAVGLRP